MCAQPIGNGCILSLFELSCVTNIHTTLGQVMPTPLSALEYQEFDQTMTRSTVNQHHQVLWFSFRHTICIPKTFPAK